MYANTFNSSPDEIHDYVRSLLDLAGDRDPLLALADTPQRLDELTRDLDDAMARRPEREGKWSIAQVLAHLADAELVTGFRYRMVAGHDTPPIAAYDQDAWATKMRYEDIPLEESLDLFTALRRANVRLLRSLTAEERQRAGMHSERGLESIDHLSRLHTGHDVVHTRQIERIRAAVGV
jgi:uncharacterized damage-inducible protein DinB